MFGKYEEDDKVYCAAPIVSSKRKEMIPVAYWVSSSSSSSGPHALAGGHGMRPAMARCVVVKWTLFACSLAHSLIH